MARVVVLGSINVDLETKIDSYPNPGEKVVGEERSGVEVCHFSIVSRVSPRGAARQ